MSDFGGCLKVRVEELANLYLSDIEGKVRPTTLRTKRAIFKAHIVPAMGKIRMCDVHAVDIMRWENRLCSKGPEFGIGDEMDKETLLETVKRYNEICDEGFD